MTSRMRPMDLSLPTPVLYGFYVCFLQSGEIGGWRLDARGQLVSLFWLRIETGHPVCLECRKTLPVKSEFPPKTPKSGTIPSYLGLFNQ